MLEGETIHTGAADICEDCDNRPDLQILFSPAGWYIGTYCDCGPYSRESGYYLEYEQVEKAFIEGGYERT